MKQKKSFTLYNCFAFIIAIVMCSYLVYQWYDSVYAVPEKVDGASIEIDERNQSEEIALKVLDQENNLIKDIGVEIVDPEFNVINTWVSTEDIYKIRLNQGQYFVRIVDTPDEIIALRDVFVEVDSEGLVRSSEKLSEDGSISLYVKPNAETDSIDGVEVKVMAIDADINTVTGSFLCIYKKTNTFDENNEEILELVDAWITTDENRSIYLPEGSYVIKEMYVNEAYKKVEDQNFIIDANENIVINGLKIDELSIMHELLIPESETEFESESKVESETKTETETKKPETNKPETSKPVTPETNKPETSKPVTPETSKPVTPETNKPVKPETSKPQNNKPIIDIDPLIPQTQYNDKDKDKEDVSESESRIETEIETDMESEVLESESEGETLALETEFLEESETESETTLVAFDKEFEEKVSTFVASEKDHFIYLLIGIIVLAVGFTGVVGGVIYIIYKNDGK